MQGQVIIMPEAVRDIEEHVVYIGERNFDAAVRFELALREDFEKLIQWPGFGALCNYPNPRLKGMRSWPITRFRRRLIFYRPILGGIEIIRVLHGPVTAMESSGDTK